MSMAGIMPWHGLALSPGILSTCFEERQCMQWLREVLLAGGVYAIQASHVKPVLLVIKFFLCCTRSVLFLVMNYCPRCASTPRFLARFTSREIMRWCFAQLPVFFLGRILFCPLVKRRKNSVSWKVISFKFSVQGMHTVLSLGFLIGI